MTDPPDTLEVALAYAALGYRVLPLCRPVARADGVLLTDGNGHVACSHTVRKEKCGKDPKRPDPGKIPLGHLTPRGVIDATTDAEVIRGWWAKAGGPLNWGIAAGPTLLILDEDTYKNEGSWDELRDACGGADLDTVVFITGGGGRHHLYRVPADTGLTQAPPKVDGKPIRGIDVRIGNGYIVGPGSLHKSGKLYAAELSCDPLEGAEPREAPAALVALLRGGEAATAASPAAQPIVDGEPVPVGKRKYTITQLAGSMHMRGLSEEAIIAAIRAENEAGRFAEAIEDAELVRAVKTVTKKPRDGRKKAAAAAAPVAPHVLPAPALHASPGVDTDGAGPDPVPEQAAQQEPAAQDGEGAVRNNLDDPNGPFVVGDATELAQRLIKDLKERDAEDLVFDQGSFWKYRRTKGIWEPLDENALLMHVALYSRRPVLRGDDDQERPLKLQESAIRGAVNVAKWFVAKPKFFDERRPDDPDVVSDGVAFKNGFLTISRDGTARLAPHSPENRARFRIDVDYDPDAPCDAWTDFFATAFDDYGATSHTDWRDPELGKKVVGAADILAREATCLEMVGAAMFGLATRYAKCFVMLGRMASNGKSTFLETIEESLFAKDTTSSVPPQDWGHKFALYNLVGKKLNVCGELPDRGMQESSIFKSVITGDSVNAEPKHRQAFSFRPRAAHIFSANSLPGSNDTTEGFWRRFIIVPWNRVFTSDETLVEGQARKDLYIKERLRAQIAGLVALAVRGACRLVREGQYTISESSREALADWQLDADQVRSFVREWCVLDKAAKTGLEDLYASYTVWARENGNGVLSKSKLGVRLRELGMFRRDNAGRYYLLRVSDEGVAAFQAIASRNARHDRKVAETHTRAPGNTPPPANKPS